jgi:PIN domain nuclease of toxin-antitoxin system
MKGIFCVLDASAFLAYIHGEEGKERVSEALGRGAAMSTVNWTEVLSKLSSKGVNIGEFSAQLTKNGLLGEGLVLTPFTEEDANWAAELFLRTRSNGLSLGDRACLALAVRLSRPVLTADRAWESVSLPIKVELIR